jgi:hypothetical protein
VRGWLAGWLAGWLSGRGCACAGGCSACLDAVGGYRGFFAGLGGACIAARPAAQHPVPTTNPASPACLPRLPAETRQFAKKAAPGGGERTFVQFILEPLYKIYAQVGGRRGPAAFSACCLPRAQDVCTGMGWGQAGLPSLLAADGAGACCAL